MNQQSHLIKLNSLREKCVGIRPNSFHVAVFEDGKETYKDLQRTCTAMFRSLKLLFGGVLVAVVAFLSSLDTETQEFEISSSREK